MKINKSDIYLNAKPFLKMKHFLFTIIIFSITIIGCKKDDDSYAVGEQQNPSPSYEIKD
tara:strand:- start:2849 stop:3025 length:177 start_codon:yes stop_codon:yes gene_type:complete